MPMRSIFRGTLWLAVAILLVYHAAAGWYYSDLIIEDRFKVRGEQVSLPTGDYRIEQVSYEAPLGEFEAWYLPGTRTMWVIHVHGVGTTPSQPEYLFEELQNAGYPQLSITYRNDSGQQPDPSGYYRYGFAEHREIEAAVSYARAQGAQRVVLSGFDAGAGHILSYLRRVDIEAVRGAIFDSPLTDLSEVVDAQITARELPVVSLPTPVTVSAVAKVFTSLRSEVNWKGIDYLDDATSLRKPVLILHGVEDSEIPIGLSREFAASASDRVTLVEFEGAGHLGSYQSNPQKYVDEILSFLSRVG
ncbi:MAG: hypothetical protein R3258_04470 [Acidimicrobiia bacterium]|nr:hypothetical protein [Acidimicrobiia bacterium]